MVGSPTPGFVRGRLAAELAAVSQPVAIRTAFWKMERGMGFLFKTSSSKEAALEAARPCFKWTGPASLRIGSNGHCQSSTASIDFVENRPALEMASSLDSAPPRPSRSRGTCHQKTRHHFKTSASVVAKPPMKAVNKRLAVPSHHFASRGGETERARVSRE